jgi:hypothetical protein
MSIHRAYGGLRAPIGPGELQRSFAAKSAAQDDRLLWLATGFGTSKAPKNLRRRMLWPFNMYSVRDLPSDC